MGTQPSYATHGFIPPLECVRIALGMQYDCIFEGTTEALGVCVPADQIRDGLSRVAVPDELAGPAFRLVRDRAVTDAVDGCARRDAAVLDALALHSGLPVAFVGGRYFGHDWVLLLRGQEPWPTKSSD